MIKKAIKSVITFLGYDIQKQQISKLECVEVKKQPLLVSNDTMSAALNRCLNRGLIPNTIIDLGAARGDWTKLAQTVWPHANYVMLEPLSERRADLEQLANSSPSIHFVESAVGDSNSKQPFLVSDDLDGSGFYDANLSPKDARLVNVMTLDHVISSLKLNGPFFIKFDTHGHELPILRGAKNVTENCVGIVMECYGFRISSNSKLLWQMCEELSQLGFRLADIVDILRRPQDHLFWQCDALFLKNEDKYFQHDSYKY